MKSIIFIFLILMSFFVEAQEITEYEKPLDLNYILGTIYWDDIVIKELSGCNVTILKQSDPKRTPEELFEGYGGKLSNLIISVNNKGEFAYSDLYFINGIISPKIIEVEEDLSQKLIKIRVKFKDKNFIEMQRIYEINALY